MISVIICTSGRESVFQTIDSVYACNQGKNDFEVIVVSQINKIKFVTRKNSRYYHLDSIGLSKARNFGIKKSRGDILCFTDDDCLVHNNWLKEIEKAFALNPRVSATFGSTLPWNKNMPSNSVCPCTFMPKRSEIISEPCYHAAFIGYGNNMAIRKEIFDRYSVFEEWLGINSVGKSAEDAEYILRLLVHQEKIYVNRKMSVYHNKWITRRESGMQEVRDTCGEFACYGYCAFLGYKFALNVLANNLWNSIREMSVSFLFSREWLKAMRKIKSSMQGLLVAFFLGYLNFGPSKPSASSKRYILHTHTH